MITGERIMAEVRRYRKPNMAALPPELGRKVIEEILNSPKPDRAALRARADEMERQMIEAERNASKTEK